MQVAQSPGTPARRLLVALAVWLALLGGLALLLRAELWTPDSGLMTASDYSLAFTMHGTFALLFMIAAVPAVLGTFAVPRLLGVGGVAQPRIVLASLVVLVATMAAMVVVSASDGADHTQPQLPLLGVLLATAGVAFNLVVTVHRAAGRGPWWQSRPFVIASYLGALALLVQVVWLDRMYVSYAPPGVFAAVRALPMLAWISAVGVFAEIAEGDRGASPRRALFAVGLVVAAATSLPVWQLWPAAAFSAGQVGMLAAVAVMAAWVFALRPGRWTAASVYALLGAWVWLLAALLEAFITNSSEVFLEDTYMVVATTHLRGDFIVLALLAGLHHWWSDLTDRVHNPRVAFAAAWVIGVGMTVEAIALFRLGHDGMPRRYYVYLPEYQALHQVSAIGAGLLALGLGWAAWNLLRAPRIHSRGGTGSQWRQGSITGEADSAG